MKNFLGKITFFMTLIALVLGIQSSTISAEENSVKDIDENSSQEEVDEEVEKYIVTDGEDVTFDYEKAKEDGQSDFVLDVGQNINQVNNAYQNEPADGEMTTMNGFPVYGNWCGPKHGGGDPIDSLDRICMMHDKEYDRYGYFDCESDARLIERINGNYDYMGDNEKKWASAIKSWMTGQMAARGCTGIIT
ncbi:hypothetical protein [Halobacillus andaensis]|uniref:hypothetical protein n=1 Tax=Halobacillus andaensis TaxID=1176239 RepID=UPI003D729D0A